MHDFNLRDRDLGPGQPKLAMQRLEVSGVDRVLGDLDDVHPHSADIAMPSQNESVIVHLGNARNRIGRRLGFAAR